MCVQPHCDQFVRYKCRVIGGVFFDVKFDESKGTSSYSNSAHSVNVHRKRCGSAHDTKVGDKAVARLQGCCQTAKLEPSGS